MRPRERPRLAFRTPADGAHAMALVRALQRTALRTARGPLGGLWSAAQRVLMRVVAAYLHGGCGAAAVYVRASWGLRDPVHGLSDIDLVAVLAGGGPTATADRERVRRREQRLRAVVPWLDRLITLAVYDQEELQAAVTSTALTHGLDAHTPSNPHARALHFRSQAPSDELGLRLRPALYGPLHDWRLLAGTERCPTVPPRRGQDRRLAAWLELQYWWRRAFEVCAGAPSLLDAHMCVKVFCGATRVLLWLERGERARGRRAVLERALALFPEEERALRFALALERELPRSPPAPVEEALAYLVRASDRVARLLARETATAGVSSVRLLWEGPDELVIASRDGPADAPALTAGAPLLPLVDWRALAYPARPDEAITPIEGDPGDIALLRAAALAGDRDPYPALAVGGLLVLPTARIWPRGVLRAVQCRLTDPVSFALIAGGEVAVFPDLQGWSASDWAERAIAEHRSWLEDQPPAGVATDRAMGLLFTAARAALFRTSLASGEPALALTVAAVARSLAQRDERSAVVAESAYRSYRRWRLEGATPSRSDVEPMRRLVRGLPGFARHGDFGPRAEDVRVPARG